MEQLDMSSIMRTEFQVFKDWDGTGATGSAEVVKGQEQRHSRSCRELNQESRHQKSNPPSPSLEIPFFVAVSAQSLRH
jgi:hypothetical protein